MPQHRGGIGRLSHTQALVPAGPAVGAGSRSSPLPAEGEKTPRAHGTVRATRWPELTGKEGTFETAVRTGTGPVGLRGASSGRWPTGGPCKDVEQGRGDSARLVPRGEGAGAGWAVRGGPAEPRAPAMAARPSERDGRVPGCEDGGRSGTWSPWPHLRVLTAGSGRQTDTGPRRGQNRALWEPDEGNSTCSPGQRAADASREPCGAP